MSDNDPTLGYEAVAKDFIQYRSSVGIEVIETWLSGFPPGCDFLDVGAGSGWPVTDCLVRAGHSVSAIEPAPSLAKVLKTRFPDVSVDQGTAENSELLNHSYDGITAIGLIFLLDEGSQRQVLMRMAKALRPSGQMMVSVPSQICEWDDLLTRRQSRSMGFGAYQNWLRKAGLIDIVSHTDEGDNHYISAKKP